jgi:hypothetical protein
MKDVSFVSFDSIVSSPGRLNDKKYPFDPVAPTYAAVQNYNCCIIKSFHNI